MVKYAPIFPAPGVSARDIEEYVKRHASPSYRCDSPDCYACVRYQTAGSTARRIRSLGNGAVQCPTCHKAVNLPEWWSHPCKIAPPEYDAVPEPRRKPVKCVAWTGDIPTRCDLCDGPIRYGFADSPLPGRSAWGFMCGLCWNLHGSSTGFYYEKSRSGRFVKVA